VHFDLQRILKILSHGFLPSLSDIAAHKSFTHISQRLWFALAALINKDSMLQEKKIQCLQCIWTGNLGPVYTWNDQGLYQKCS